MTITFPLKNRAGARRLTALASFAVLGAVALTGCGTSTAPSNTGPQTAVQNFLTAFEAADAGTMCSLVLPSEAGHCQSEFASGLPAMTFTDMALHQTVIDGDRALVSVTGKICVTGGNCTGSTDPNSGMPGAGLSFEQAFNHPSPDSAAAQPVEELNGTWYVVLGSN